AIAVGAVAAMFAVFLLKPQNARPDLSGVAAAMATAEGVAAVDMPAIPRALDWHAAKAEDFAPDVASWMKGGGAVPSGRIPLQIEPGDTPRDVAYWLVKNKDSGNRLVVIQNGVNIYDAQYPDVVAVARIPFADLANVEWATKPTVEPTGDAVMLVRRTEASIVARVFFFK